MAQNKDLKTRAQIQRELNNLLKQEEALKAKIARYEKEGVENIDEEKKAYADLKKKVEDFGKTAKKVNDGRRKEFKASQKAAEEYGQSLTNKIEKALGGVDKATRKAFADPVKKGVFQNLGELAGEFADSTEKGADKAAQLTGEIAELQAEVIKAGAGFRNLSDDQAEALNSKIKELEKTAGDVFQGAFSEGGDAAGEIFKSMKDSAKAGKGFAHHATTLAEKFDISLTKADLLASAAAAIASAVESAAEQAQKFQDSLGVSNRLARQQIFTFRNIGLSFIGLNDDIGDANIQLGLAANNLDVATGRSKNLSQNISFIARDTGASLESLATVNQLFQNTAGLTAEQASQLQLGLVSMSEMAGVIPGQVLEDMATNAEMLSKFSDGTAEGMARAAIQAQKLGINLSKAGQIADSLLNLESSIASEFEASVLIGRELNFDRARNLALNNDIEGAMKDIVDQLGSEEEFNRLNAIQRQALADSIGVGVEDLAAMVRRGGEGAAEVDIGVKLQKQANKTLTEILFQLSAGMVGTITAGFATAIGTLIGVKGLAKFLGSKGILAKTMAKVSSGVGVVSKILGRVSGALAIAFDAFKFFTGDSGEKSGAAAGLGFAGIGALLGSFVFPGIGTLLGAGIGSIVGHLVNSIFPKVGATIAAGIDGVLNGIGAIPGVVGDLAKAGFALGSDGMKFIGDFFSDVGSSVLSGAMSLGNAAINVYDAVTAAFSNLGQTVIDGITSVFDALIQQAKDLISGLMDFGDSIADFFGFGGDEGDVADDFISRPGAGVQKFAPTDTVIGVRDPGILSALAGNRGMSESGTKQVALLTTLVNNSNVQMAEIIRTNKEITAAVNNIGRSSGA